MLSWCVFLSKETALITPVVHILTTRTICAPTRNHSPGSRKTGLAANMHGSLFVCSLNQLLRTISRPVSEAFIIWVDSGLEPEAPIINHPVGRRACRCFHGVLYFMAERVDASYALFLQITSNNIFVTSFQRAWMHSVKDRELSNLVVRSKFFCKEDSAMTIKKLTSGIFILNINVGLKQ